METVQQMSPVSMLSLMNSNKAQRKSFCLQIIEQMENGEVDPLQCHIFLKNIEQIFKMLTDEKTGKEFAVRYKAALMNAADKEGGNSFEKYNAKFQKKEAGTKYDWAVCNDPVVIQLQEKLEAIKKELDERQEFLKTIPTSGLIVTDQDSGETTTVFPPSKTSATTIAVTLS
jgi:hypothetical protein